MPSKRKPPKDCAGPADGTPCPAKRIIPAKQWYCETCRDARKVAWRRERDRLKNEEEKTLYVRNESGYPGVQKSHQTEGKWIGLLKHDGKIYRTRSHDVASECYKDYLELYFQIKGEYYQEPKERVSSLRGEANTPLERYNRVMQYLINIA